MAASAIQSLSASTASAKEAVLNIGVGGAVLGAICVQGTWALDASWRSSREDKTPQQLQEQGHKFQFLDDMSKLPHEGGAVDEVITNHVPLDRKTHFGPGPSMPEIRRVQKKDGKCPPDGDKQ